MPIADLLLDGMQLANKRYERWTGGWWITDVGVERYVVSTILETLHHNLPRRQVSVSELSSLLQNRSAVRVSALI